ncbi:MAG: hypothetical protein J6B56_05110 [Clostridia bacterium]|nr:hypothetical protein [Clostridia bacterium]
MIYEIANLRISIKNRCKYTEIFCEKYLSNDQAAPFDLEVSVTDEEFYEEKKISEGYSDGYIENICLYRAICRCLPKLNRMLLHAAVLEYEGNAYAFLGRSGTGKSTHTGLWLKHLNGSKIVNGDKPILEYKESGFVAYGTPWMGKEGLGYNGSAPLKGLCFLEQAKENSVLKLTPAQAASRIFVQILMPEDEANAALTLELTDKLVTEIPCYLLKCNVSEEAVQKSFEALTGKTYKK